MRFPFFQDALFRIITLGAIDGVTGWRQQVAGYDGLDRAGFAACLAAARSSLKLMVSTAESAEPLQASAARMERSA
jgi:hypothetical protein